jgi:CRP-like cAMP-binding protein
MKEAGLAVGDMSVPCGEETVGRLAARHVVYGAGEAQTLFYAGHRPAGFFLLLEGRVDLVPERGRAVEVCGPAILGLHHLMESQPYPVTALAARGARLAFVPRRAAAPEPRRRTTDHSSEPTAERVR